MEFERDKRFLETEWFSGRVVVSWPLETSGVEGGVLRLGGYERISGNVAMTAHEMAHLVEIDDRRATQGGFGLRYKRTVTFPPTRYSSGIYPEPLTPQGVERECRVIAISQRILEACGWTDAERSTDAESTIGALRHLADWWNVPRKTEEKRREWCRRKVMCSLPLWPAARVCAEWDRKVELVTRRLIRREREATRAASRR